MARKIIQISDLHFGRTDPEVIRQVGVQVNSFEPDLVIVSGDLTQRAKVREFEQAKEFLNSIVAAKIVVPGNHDIPLYNLVRRFMAGLGRYKKYISNNLQPVFEDEEIVVVGINTARSNVWKSGRINSQQINEAIKVLSASKAHTKIVVTHHPFDLPTDFTERKLIARSMKAMQAFAANGVDLFLSGHFHRTTFSLSSERFRLEGRAALIIQAGTVSTRSRGEGNSFNVLSFDEDKLSVEHYVWDGLKKTFHCAKLERFAELADKGWYKL